MLRQNTSGDFRPDTLGPRDDNTNDTVFGVDPIIRLCLDEIPPNASTYATQFLVFIDLVHDYHDLGVRWPMPRVWPRPSCMNKAQI